MTRETGKTSTASSPDYGSAMPVDPLLTDSEGEALLNVGRGFLAKDRCSTARIPFVKIGRSVRYRRSDILAFIRASLRRSTSDQGGEDARIAGFQSEQFEGSSYGDAGR
jgi:hypothetical protein